MEMKLYISADIEGVAGVVHGEHTARDGREHDRARLLMTEEVNACIRGALSVGVSEIVVNDSHGTMRNLLPELLHPEAELISGSPKKLAMVEGLDETFDAAIFLGYHTKKGDFGLLNHTFNGKVVRSIVVNGKEYGEFGLNALVAGHFGIPVICVSGCDRLALEARELIPMINTAVVKQTINQFTAKSVHPKKAQEMIESETQKSWKNRENIVPCSIEGPVSVEMTFNTTGYAENAAILPVVEQIDPSTVSFKANNIIEGYRFIRSLIMIAS
ncbi:M55 family metallopeptidase [Heyndrickxia sp. NPDC080065]|uniref:M55 family metallopeptidase n=1 Tax=Heyndrickxia sp. NPDC080065 TaxID=3390568 RepID=UPI003CFC031E